jgi:SAM-dependent methyltransferase
VGKIERLDFTVPDFLRIVWASEAAREYWGAKIHRLSDLWRGVELLTLTQEMRNGILQSIRPLDLPAMQGWALSHNVPMAIVGVDGQVTGAYGNAAVPYQDGKQFTYRVYFGITPEKFIDAWHAQDDLAIGYMLGFPDCCSRFFQKHWKEGGWRDYTALTFDGVNQKNLIYNNVLLRHLGIRGVFHLPCSVDCKRSCMIGQGILELMDANGFNREMNWLRELLSMPMQWTSLHGVAMVVTPILKTTYASDALPRKVTLNLHSEEYPHYGASGNQFPFTNVMPLQFGKSWNGFKSLEAMQAAHFFIVTTLPNDISGGIKGKVLDLGCGTGQLLKTIQKAHPETFLYGVESDAAIINKAAQGVKYWQSDIFEFRAWEEVDLTLIAIQRLYEVPESKAMALMEVIRTYSEMLLIYSYDGWFDDIGKFIEPYFDVVTVSKEPIKNLTALLLKGKDDVLRHEPLPAN